MKPHLLIDGDIFAYRAAAGAEKIVCWDGDNCFPVASLSEAKRAFDNSVADLLQSWRTDLYTVVLSDTANFRKKLSPSYKRGRKSKPVCYGFLKSYIEKEYKALRKPELEGDDLLGILATSPVIVKNPNKIIISVDKDMKTIPGVYYDAGRDERNTISYADANRAHMTQTLTGDITDGYPGCPGVGPKKAMRILEGKVDYDDIWREVIRTYENAGLTVKDALLQARLARILRNYDYDFKGRAPLLWSPASEQRRKIETT